MNKRLNFLFYLFVFLSVFLLDRVTKFWALRFLLKNDYMVFPGLNFTLVCNRGVTWGLLSFDSSGLFYFLSLIIAFVVVLFCFHTYSLFKRNKNVFFEILIFGGAVSNLVDRFLYKGVIDFIDIYIGSWHWAIFNIADLFVVIGVVGIFGRFLLNGYFRKN